MYMLYLAYGIGCSVRLITGNIMKICIVRLKAF